MENLSDNFQMSKNDKKWWNWYNVFTCSRGSILKINTRVCNKQEQYLTWGIDIQIFFNAQPQIEGLCL